MNEERKRKENINMGRKEKVTKKGRERCVEEERMERKRKLIMYIIKMSLLIE